MPADTPEQVREFLADCRLRRYGWARFQDSTRRTAERMARKPADEPETDTAV